MQTCVQRFSFYCTQVVLRQLKRCCKQVVLQHLKAVRKEYNINVYNGFLEQTTRLLFVPDANFWDREFEGQKVWIKTVKPNGVIEATKKLGAGDGIFTFVNSLNMQTGVETMENPYCFEREDGTKAVVQLWKKASTRGSKITLTCELWMKASALIFAQFWSTYSDTQLCKRESYTIAKQKDKLPTKTWQFKVSGEASEHFWMHHSCWDKCISIPYWSRRTVC